MGLDLVELVVSFEESFGIEFANEAASKMVCAADVIDYVMQRLSERGEIANRTLVAEIVRLRVIEQLGINPKRYREDARFVEDYGAD
jgi:acyl carrier protein